MGKLLERYAQAVNSDSLVVDPRTTWSDTDVLGATGLAAKHEPLGLALARLFAGGKSETVIVELTEMVFKRARTLHIKVSQVQAADLSRAVLGWYQHGSCEPCGGTGSQRVKDTPTLGGECPHCNGGGRMVFDRLFQDGICEDCGGEPLRAVGRLTYHCMSCECSGSRPITETRAAEQTELARWLSGEIERSQAAAGSAAMAMLAPTLELR